MRSFNEKIFRAHEMDVDTFNSLDKIYHDEMKNCKKPLNFWKDSLSIIHHGLTGPIY